MPNEISIRSNSRVSRIREEIDGVLDRCNIRISIFDGDEEIDDYGKKLKDLVDKDQYNFGSKEFTKRKTIGNFEEEFQEQYGLRVEMNLPDGSKAPEEWRLSDYEDEFKVKQNILEDPFTKWINDELFDGERPPMGEANEELEKLAEKAGVNPKTVKDIFYNEVKNPQYSTLEKIADSLGEDIPKNIKRKYDSSTFSFFGDWNQFNPCDRQDWPDEGISGVYIILDENEDPLYVGKSSRDIRSRLKKHSGRKWWYRKMLGNSYYVSIEENRFNEHKGKVINDVERLLIKSLNPLINDKG
jgi:transcriptional regulator with XRE-family HTH domain